MENEFYCIGKRADMDGDRECYYHGPLKVCPLCGKATKVVRPGTYTPQKGYSLRELGW